MTMFDKISGRWRPIPKAYVRVSGAWKTVSKIFVKVSGAWKEVFTDGILLTISANTYNYNIKSAAVAAGWNGTDVIVVAVTINAGVKVGSTTTATPAMRTDTGWPTGCVVVIINNGTIEGKGGAGGTTFHQGSAGGHAVRADIATQIINNGTIAGGGGGGGSGGMCSGVT